MSFAVFDIDRFPASMGSDGEPHPTVVITFNGAPKNHDDMQAYLNEFEATLKTALEMGVTMRFVINIKSVSALEALSFLWYIDKQVEFIKRIAVPKSFDETRRLVDGIYYTAIVAGDKTKAMLDAVLDRVTLQKPYVALLSTEEGAAWNPPSETHQ